MKKTRQTPSRLPRCLRASPGPRPAPEAAGSASLPGTFAHGTQIRGAGAGPGDGTGWTVGKMAAAVAGPRGCGAAVGEEADSGNGRRCPNGSG